MLKNNGRALPYCQTSKCVRLPVGAANGVRLPEIIPALRTGMREFLMR